MPLQAHHRTSRSTTGLSLVLPVALVGLVDGCTVSFWQPVDDGDAQVDCDSSAGNGCEVDLATNASNCGQCGQGCSANNANMGCANSACVFLSCVGDWRDCDSNLPSNGCETLVTNDDLNCGACGSVCPAGFNCSSLNCRCTTDTDCDTGGGGVCDPLYNMCKCPIVLYSGPRNATNTNCL